MDELWEEIRAVARDGETAWPALAARLHPALLPIARNQSIGRLRRDEDSPREIVTRVLERLHANDFAALKKLVVTDPAPPLGAWMRVVVKRCAIDYMRAEPTYQRATKAHDHRWISLRTLNSFVHAADPSTLREKREALIRFVTTAVARVRDAVANDGDDALQQIAVEWKIARLHVKRMHERGERYLKVLDGVFAGSSHAEIASARDMSEREVELTVQYLVEFLQARRFG
ncbi:MAG TPA: hypothetical protein VGM39_00270 [Kofleriaceae bacterium]